MTEICHYPAQSWKVPVNPATPDGLVHLQPTYRLADDFASHGVPKSLADTP